MPFNGSGVFQRVRSWVADAAAGIKIRADYHDAEDDGFAAGLTNCIAKDGQSVITQNIPFNNKRITGLADPVNAQDASTKAYADTKLSGTGDVTMPGDLILTSASPDVVLNSTDPAGAMQIQGQRNGLLRWLMRLGNGVAETGANAGSDFDLNCYDDAGALIATPLAITRATGLGTVKGDPTVPLGIATKQYVDAKIAALPAPDPQLFAGIPMNPQGTYTTVATDAQKCIVGTGGVTINGGLYPIGAVITFVAFGGAMTIANNTTMYWVNPSGAPIPGNRSLADRGIATAVKLHDNSWVIGGNGLT